MNTTKTPAWSDGACTIALLLLLPLFFMSDIVFGGQILNMGDLHDIHYPLRVLVADMWRAGQWPLWNPYVLCGFPLLAEGQVGVLYLPNLLFVLPIPYYHSLNLFVALHLGMAAVFAYWLGRSLGMTWSGALLTGLSYGWGGIFIAQIPNLNVMTGAVWLPMVLCLFVYALRRQSWFWCLAGSLALAFQAFTSQPQIIFYTWLLLLAYLVYHLMGMAVARAKARDVLRALALAVLCLGLGAALASAQILPTMELWQISVRSQGLNYKDIVKYSLHPLQLTELWIPNLFGNPATGYEGLGNFEEAFCYLGLLPLCLAAISWPKRLNSRQAFFSVAPIVSLLLAFGGYTPLYPYVLQHLPGFNLFRVPGRWMIVASISIAVLAGFGLDDLVTERQKKTKQIAKWALYAMASLSVIGLIAVLVLSLRREELRQWVMMSSLSKDTIELLEIALKRFAVAPSILTRSWLPNAFPWITIPGPVFLCQAILAAGLFAVYIKRFLTSRSLSFVLIGFTTIDLFLAGGTGILVLDEPNWWNFDSELISHVKERAGNYRVHLFINEHLEDSWAQARKGDPDLARELHTSTSWAGAYIPSAFGVFVPMGHWSPLRLERFNFFIKAIGQKRAFPPDSLAADLMSVKYIMTWGPLQPLPDSLRQVAQIENVYIYENAEALPRAYVAYKFETFTEGDREQVARTLLAPDFDLSRNAVVEGHIDDISPSEGLITPARIIHYSPLRVIIEAEPQHDGILVLTDSYYPGWRATVDGHEAPIKRANLAFRAVPIKAGKHTVEFTYEAPVFKAGLFISGITWASVIILMSIMILKRKKFIRGKGE